jgi:hypothetical protein
MSYTLTRTFDWKATLARRGCPKDDVATWLCDQVKDECRKLGFVPISVYTSIDFEGDEPKTVTIRAIGP